MAELKFTKTHEWVKYTEDGKAKVGLTEYAQQQLGDLVFINLPEEGDCVTVEDTFCDVESVKAVSDVYSPLTGTIARVNEDLLDAPELINEHPYEAWIAEIEDITETAEFLSEDEYETFIKSEA